MPPSSYTAPSCQACLRGMCLSGVRAYRECLYQTTLRSRDHDVLSTETQQPNSPLRCLRQVSKRTTGKLRARCSTKPPGGGLWLPRVVPAKVGRILRRQPTRRADRRRRRERRAAGASRRQAASTTPPLRVARRHHGRRRPQPLRQLVTSMTAIRVATSATSALARVFRSGQRRCPRSRNVAPRRHSSRNPGLYRARFARQAGQCPRRGVANRRFPRGRCAFTRASRSSQRPQSIVTPNEASHFRTRVLQSGGPSPPPCSRQPATTTA